MRMIPPYPLETRSTAEKKIFDRLVTTLEGNEFTAFHSMNLPRHPYKRFAEIDFLITGPAGIFVLEIKGGRVACQNGIWQFTDAYGRTDRHAESPFQQARSALHGLMAQLSDRFEQAFLSRFPMGYGVICPDCRPGVNGSEWEPAVLMDAGDMNNLEQRLANLFSHWQARPPGGTRPGPRDIEALNAWLRPEFESTHPLFDQVQAIRSKAAHLTREQMVFTDIIQANPRVICSGGAGTGKTFLAMELARQWTAPGKKVALTCGSEWLKNYLENRFPMPGLTLTRVDALGPAARRTGIDRFDALIVDEGQDLFDMNSLSTMDQHLAGGLAHGQWAFFHDINNQSGLFVPPDPNAVAWLEACTPARVPLSTNCRNTLNILNRVKKRLGADMGVRGAGMGPEVREHKVPSISQAIDCLAREIRYLLEPGQLSLSRITILSPLPFSESAAARLPWELLRDIVVLDPWAMRHFPPQAMSFARIHEFKGLENEAVIVIDLPQPRLEYRTAFAPQSSLKSQSNRYSGLTAHYVAMSRARSLLCIIYTDHPNTL